MFYENLKITGELHIVLRDETGKIKQELTVPNMVVNKGKSMFAKRLISNSLIDVPSHMSIGSVGTETNITHEGLLSELITNLAANVRPGFTTPTPSIGGDVNSAVTFSSTFAAGVGTGEVREAAIFNAVTGGTMLCRTTFGVVTKAPADTLTINWTVTVN